MVHAELGVLKRGQNSARETLVKDTAAEITRIYAAINALAAGSLSADNASNQPRHSLHWLKPGPVTNELLSSLVRVSKTPLLEAEVAAVFKLLEGRVDVHWDTRRLQSVSVIAEELMEENTLRLILRAWGTGSPQKQPSFGETPEGKLELLHRVLVSVPDDFITNNADELDGRAFKYYSNYVHLVQGELKLLESLSSEAWYRAFKKKKLGDLKFTHVGCGFPLSGIMLHILTGGATVALVDRSQTVVSQVQQLLDLLRELEVIDADGINLVRADASQLTYSTDPRATGKDAEGFLCTDVLDISASVSSRSTNILMSDCARSVAAVRKRHVRGLSALLYETYEAPENLGFTKTASVVPPKDYHGPSKGNDGFVAGLLHASNVCCCDLYMNTTEYFDLSSENAGAVNE